jgi:hypothetical protein
LMIRLARIYVNLLVLLAFGATPWTRRESPYLLGV